MRVTGNCHCGAIAFEADVEPGTSFLCHCGDCQKLSGSAFRANISSKAFRILRGEPRRYIRTADSGNRRVNAFCADCGTSLFSCAPESPSRWSIRLGSIDQRDQLGFPRAEIWTKSQCAWVAPIAGAKHFAGEPEI
jgi:hypothetical protein